MSFWTSYDTEAEWDHLFVEARSPGGDDWTTLPDANGNTTTSTGQSCPAGWVTLHPQLAHYQTFDGVVTTSPLLSQSGQYVDFTAFEEAAISTLGHDASIPTRGRSPRRPRTGTA